MIAALALTLLQVTAPVHTHGHMIGEVRTDSAVLWTRADRSVDAQLELSTTPDFQNPLVFAHASRSPDHTFHFAATGLSPGTKYFYRTTLLDPVRVKLRTTSAPGSFRTAPDTSTDVRFVAACEFYERQSYPGVAELEQENPDFFLMLGDLPYADKGVPATTLAEFRTKHGAVHAAPEFLSFLAKIPYYGVFDDHEVTNDWDSTKNPALVQAGLQAWREWKPFILPSSGAYYRSFAWGKDLRVFLLDTRSERGSNFDADDAKHSMLGAAQKQWLLRELKAATETFKVIVTSVPLRSGWKWRDHWAGYQRERSEIFAAIQSDAIEGVVFVSGDHHFSARNHHAEGITELIVGALDAHHNTPPLERDPAMVEVRTGPCYLRGIVDTTTMPKRLELEIVQAGKVTMRETILSEQQLAHGSFSAAPRDAALVLDGPRRLRVRGRDSRRLRLEPGDYVVHATASKGGRYVAPPMKVSLPAAASLAVGVIPGRTRRDFDSELLFEDFEGAKIQSAFASFDAGTPKSEWFVDGGRLWHSSRTNSGKDDEPGAQIVFGADLGDQVVRTRVRSWGPESFGVLVRHGGVADYYWLDLDTRKQRMRFGVRAAGKFRVLQSLLFPVESYRSYDIEVRAIGDLFVISIDGDERIRVRDGTHARGKPGLACNSVSLFAVEDFQVVDTARRDPAALRDTFESPGLGFFWRVVDGASAGAWNPVGGRMLQTAYVADVEKLGTNLISDVLDLRDVTVRSEIQVKGAGRVGLWCRYTQDGNGYRAWIDPLRRSASIERYAARQATSLAAAQDLPLEVNRRHEVEFVAVGDELILRVDGVEILKASDSKFLSGRVGLHTYAQSTASFEGIVAERIDELGVVATLVGHMRQYRYEVSAPALVASSLPTSAMLMISDATSPPIDLKVWDDEARVLPLALTPLLSATIGGAAGVLDREGSWSTVLAIPNDASLRGKPFFIGGVLVQAASSGTKMRPLPSLHMRID